MKYQLLSNLQQMLNNWLTLLSNCSIKYNLFSKYMADTEQQVVSNTDQQVTSKTPATKPKEKNPKRVAAGKLVAERTRIAPSAEPTKNVLATTQWLSIISIVVSLAGVYYKREEIKNVLTKKAAPPSPVLLRAPPPSPATPKRSISKMD